MFDKLFTPTTIRGMELNTRVIEHTVKHCLCSKNYSVP